MDDRVTESRPEQVDGAAFLQQAAQLVQAFCRQLALILQQARQGLESLDVEIRKLRRFLDELEVRTRLLQEGTAPAATSVSWQEELEQARRQERALWEKISGLEEAIRRIDLLHRQVEMSGESLHRQEFGRSEDPWDLALRSQVLYGREQERVALAREVHDGPAQVLSNLILGLERGKETVVEQEHLVGHLETLIRDSRMGLQEVRRFIYDLRPSPLADEPLEQQIERYVRDFEATYQVPVEFRWDVPARFFSPEETIAIYRIVQEGLRNAQKHARARHLLVEVYSDATAWIVQVRDDGVGFDLQAVQRDEERWGIAGMQERARLIGADLQIESRPGEGTTLSLRIPLRLERVEKEARVAREGV